MRAITRGDMVALEVTGDVAEGGGVAVDIEGSQWGTFFTGGELALEELRKV
jgi:hypothetical protein